jgi:ribosomal protein S18 acetylase RimI-like enzyme
MTETRSVTQIDHNRNDVALAQTLADAFQDDPAFAWIIPDPVKRRIVFPKLFGVILNSDRKSGLVLASPAYEAVTLWRAPGKTDAPMREMIGQAIPLLGALGLSIGRALTLSHGVEAHHPAHYRGSDYWYLHIAGVSPQHQGKGWGGVAIREGLARAAAASKPVLLETAQASNIPLYQRLGFVVTQEWDAPKGGPHFWTMLREHDA